MSPASAAKAADGLARGDVLADKIEREDVELQERRRRIEARRDAGAWAARRGELHTLSDAFAQAVIALDEKDRQRELAERRALRDVGVKSPLPPPSWEVEAK